MRYCCLPGAGIGQKLSSDESRGHRSEPVAVPHTELAAETLRRVVESFILREGTDYGEREASLEQKLQQVYRQLETGEAQIVFDPASDSIDIIPLTPSGRRR